MDNFEQSCLPQVREGLAEVFGIDLAESLVNAAMNREPSSVTRQLLINDGLAEITPDQRAKALELLEIFETTLS